MAFNSGGFFAGGPAVAAVLLACALAAAVMLEERPFAGIRPAGALALAGLGGMALVALVSGAWSGSWSRALIEFDRVLAYLLAFALFTAVAARRSQLAWMLRAFAFAALVVCAVGLASRLFPSLVETAPEVSNRRLNHPITYWNSLGLLATLGALASVHIASDLEEPRWARVVAAGAVPLLLVTLLFTFSRAAIAAGVLGLILYVLIARPRGLPAALTAIVPPSAICLITAYGAERLASRTPTSAAAASQADDVALVTTGAIAAALILRALLLPADRRIAAVRLPKRPLRLAAAGLAGLAIAVLAGAAIAADVPNRVGDEYERFARGNEVKSGADARTRLGSLGNNGRVANWEVALEAFEDRPLLGQGAGTYELLWFRDRPRDFDVVDAHSLYIESLAELGLIGAAFLLLALASICVGLVLRARGKNRALYGALLAMAASWLLCAGIDWQWEMPVATLWLFALSGAALGSPRRGAAEARARPPLRSTARIVGALACLLLGVTPALIYLSQRQLDRGVAALKRGDCGEAVDSSLGAARVLPVRPEPFEVLAYCDVRRNRPRLALVVMQAAVKRDPDSWRLHYGHALIRGAAGLDPRPQARRALRLNPFESLTRRGVRRFATSDPRLWRRRALQARLPLD